jgi:hypothetical protein
VTRRVVAVLVLGGVAVVAVVTAWATRSGPGEAVSRDEVLAYQEGILGHVRQWGRIEVQGMRPAVADLQSKGGVPAESIAGEARAWQTAFRRIRRDLRAVHAPGELAAVAAAFDRAIADYLRAAATFERAASTAPGAEQDRLVDDGLAVVRRGAARYNEASMLLQAARRAAGLPPTDDFPDQPAAAPPQDALGVRALHTGRGHGHATASARR